MFISRREFLISTLFATANAAANRLPFGHPQSSPRVGFVGLGARGQANLACMATGTRVHITALCDKAEARLEESTELLPTTQRTGVRVYSDLAVFLRKEKPDFIVVSVPPPAQRSIFRSVSEEGLHFASETPISSALATDANNFPSTEQIQLLPRYVLSACDSVPAFLLTERVNTIEIVHRTPYPIHSDTAPSLKNRLFEELGDSIDAAITLFGQAVFDSCKAFSTMRPRGSREFAFRFSQQTTLQPARLNISVIAPAAPSQQHSLGDTSSDTLLTVSTNRGRLSARTIPRPESSTRLYLSNLAHVIAGSSPTSLLNPLSTRLTSYSLISSAVDQLPN